MIHALSQVTDMSDDKDLDIPSQLDSQQTSRKNFKLQNGVSMKVCNS